MLSCYRAFCGRTWRTRSPTLASTPSSKYKFSGKTGMSTNIFLLPIAFAVTWRGGKCNEIVYVCVCVCVPVSVCVCVPVSVCACLSECLCLSVCLSLSSFFCLSVSLASFFLSVFYIFCPFLCLSLFVYSFLHSFFLSSSLLIRKTKKPTTYLTIKLL